MTTGSDRAPGADATRPAAGPPDLDGGVGDRPAAGSPGLDTEPGGRVDGHLDTRKVAAARLWATTQFPYLASAVFAAPVSTVPGLGRVVVDRWWRIHADPAVVASTDVESLGGELIHLTTHLLRDHASRADAVGLAEPAELHHWVDATDAEIADDYPAELSRIEPPLAPADLDCAEGRLAEEYYRRGSVREGSTADCGSGAHGHPSGWEPPPPSGDRDDAGLDRREQEAVRRRVASEILAADRRAVADGLRRWAERALGPTVDWRAELAAVLRRAHAAIGGAVDYSYARPSRRSIAVPGVVLPSLRRPTVEVAVVCDTSASVSEELLASAVGEIDGLIRAAGTRSATVIACDDAVRATSRVRAVDDLVLIGGGGTDLSVGLGAALAERPRPDLVVIVTDGYTPWPSAPPPVPVVVAVLATDEPVPPPEPPPWAAPVAIDTP